MFVLFLFVFPYPLGGFGNPMGHRIIEIEWSVENNKEYVPTPKPPRKQRTSKQPRKLRSKSNPGQEVDLENKSLAGNDEAMEVDDDNCAAEPSKAATKGQRLIKMAEFGMEVTNTGSSLSKRSFADTQEDRKNALVTQSPQKRQKRSVRSPVVNDDSEDDTEPPALAKKSRKVALQIQDHGLF
jgi:kinesin family protein 22